MADQRIRRDFGPLVLRGEDDALLTAATVAAKIQNMRVTDEGTLRAMTGILPFVPDYDGEGAPLGSYTTATLGPPLQYGPIYGIGWARIGTDRRPILLLHTGPNLWRHDGPTRTWVSLATDLPNNVDVAQPPTLFLATPGGIIIAPFGGRARFYDGEVLAPLGYEQIPGAPAPSGPITDATSAPSSTEVVNIDGYAHDGNPTTSRAWPAGTQMHPSFGSCRVGTVEGDYSAGMSGVLLDGEWRLAVQWVDNWGNLSPVSNLSAPVILRRELANNATPNAPFTPDRLLKQFYIGNIQRGPSDRTVGRVLGATRDLRHSGTSQVFEVPNNASGGETTFATIPDNVTESYPYNVPDSWLLRPMTDVVPMPAFDVGCVAFGRLFVFERGTGRLMWSQPGRWGTFVDGDSLFPDPAASDGTGLALVQGGLVATTERSTFLVVPNEAGDGFKASGISNTVGCVAPATMRTLHDGTCMWLGADGFYRLSGAGLVPESSNELYTMRFIPRSRQRMACAVLDPGTGEYLAWVPYWSIYPNSFRDRLGLIRDTEGQWRRSTMVHGWAATAMTDHTRHVLVAGEVTRTTPPRLGVWVLNHRAVNFPNNYLSNYEHAQITTAWIDPRGSDQRKTAVQVRLWFRETIDSTITVETMRDWREEVLDSITVPLYPTDDEPLWWGEAVLGTSGAKWNRRRPFWSKVDIYVPACEVFKIRLTPASSLEEVVDWEFVGLTAVANPKADGKAMVP